MQEEVVKLTLLKKETGRKEGRKERRNEGRRSLRVQLL
jgi:hypothetical protein